MNDHPSLYAVPAGTRRIPISDRTELVKQPDGQWRAESRREYDQWLAVDDEPEWWGCALIAAAIGAVWAGVVWVTWRWLR